MAIFAYVTDLLFSTKITSTGQALGVPVTVARGVDTLIEKLNAASGDDSGGLVIIDLNVTGDPVDAIRRLKALPSPPRVIAFLSHVQVELATAARNAGADEVMPRSAFSMSLPAILRSAGASRSEHTS